MIAGRVLHDAGPGQPIHGVQGVAISDGLAITQTDADGRYRLAVNLRRRHDVLVHITVPAGWRAPLGAHGSPNFWQPVDLAGDASAADVDFALYPDPQSRRDEYRFVALADVHVDAAGLNPRDAFRQQLDEIARLTEAGHGRTGLPAFITVAGDLTNNATVGEFRDYLAATATTSIPVWPAVGNHDLVGRTVGGPYPKPSSRLSYRELIQGYRQAVGPEWYSFQYGDHHFVVLENYRGLTELEQLVWLERDLALHAAGKKVVVVSHVPWNTPQTPIPAVTAAFTDLLAAHDVTLMVAGHTHANDVTPDAVGKARQIVTTTAGAVPLDGTPRGFRTIEFYDGGIHSPFFEFDASRKATVVHPVGKVPWSPSEVVINRYTPPGTSAQVQFRVPPRDWLPLEPFGRRAWRAPLNGADLRGRQNLQVRIREGNSREWERTSTEFDIDGGAAKQPTQGAPWPMFHADPRHSGRASDDVNPPLRVAWATHTGGTVLTSSPVVSHDMVFLGVRDEDENATNGVVALDLGTGAVVWRQDLDSPVEGTVAVSGDLVLAASARGRLCAFDVTTGKRQWAWSPNHAERPHSWMYFSPTISGGCVYQAYSVADGTWVACLDALTGHERWRTEEPVGRSWFSHAAPAVSGDLVTFASAYANLVALNRDTGQQRFQKALGAGVGVHAKPVVADGVIYLSCSGNQLIAVASDNGEERWRHTSTGDSALRWVATGATPAVADDVVYAAFADGYVTALSSETGEAAWSYRAAGPVISSPAISGDFLYVGSHDGQMRALDRHSGTCVWSHDIGAWIASSPAVTGNTVIIASWDGTVYAFVAA